MTLDPAVIPGLLLLAAELVALAAVGYIDVGVVLRQTNERVALAQGLVVGLALWLAIVSPTMNIGRDLRGLGIATSAGKSPVGTAA